VAAPLGFHLDTYRQQAQEFLEELNREYYLHLAGHKPELGIEAIYERHTSLFERPAVVAIRELAGAAIGERARALRYLLHFAVEGLIGRECRSEAAELASLEAALEVEGPDGAVPYRGVAVNQANEPDRERREALEIARNEVLRERLNPLHRTMLERSHALCAELGWPSYVAAFAELRGLDLTALARQTARFLELTAEPYAELIGAELAGAGMPAVGELRRSDLPRFFRAPALDRSYPASRMLESFTATLAGLGIDLGAQANIHLDTEARPTKSPRAFCATPKVPQEIYLVVAPVGGRDDYAALFHEGGHAEHYAATDPDLEFEYRQLGDNSVTESFAMLLDHLTEDAAWLRAVLGAESPEPAVRSALAVRLLFLRRYAAKLDYELALHGRGGGGEDLAAGYARRMRDATAAEWPAAGWLADVDEGFYVACYLRAWDLESRWRRALTERFGEGWFASPAAGKWLRGLWRQGQRLSADELLAEALGEQLGFADLAAEFRD
jgi:hypothetical protein